MAGGFPVGFQMNCMGGSTPTSAGGLSLTSGATANTVGSYVELVTSTPRNSTWALVVIQDSGTATGGQTSSVNIATGASGSEVVQIANLVIQRDSLSSLPGDCANYFFPWVLPAGTRIAANCQDSAGAVPLSVSIMLFDDAMASIIGGGAIDTIGFSTGTTLGTTIDPGTTTFTKGAYSQLSSSLTYDLAGFFLGFDGQGGTGSSQARWTLDIATGSSGNEVVLLPDFQLYSRAISTSSKPIYPPNTPYFPIQIPAGTRVSARAQCNVSTSTTRKFGVTLYGVRL